MGNLPTLLRWALTGKVRYRVIMVGLDAAGKTTVLYQLKKGEQAQTIPTVGFNVEEVTIGPVALKIWDVGGQVVLRELWKNYMSGSSSAVIFVVDSSDHDRMGEAKEELHALLQLEAASKAILLVLANKQDHPGALNGVQVSEALQISALANVRCCSVFEVTAIKGTGLKEAMDWLANELMSKK